MRSKKNIQEQLEFCRREFERYDKIPYDERVHFENLVRENWYGKVTALEWVLED